MRMRMLLACVVLWLGLGKDGAGSPVTLFWDANGEDAGTGGTGEWNLTDQTWRSGSASGALQSWVNLNRASLGGTAGTITLADDIVLVSDGALAASVSGYVIDGDAGGDYSLALLATDQWLVARTASSVSLTINAPVVLTNAPTGTSVAQIWFRAPTTFNGPIDSGGVAHRLWVQDGQTLTFNNARPASVFRLEGVGTVILNDDQAAGSGDILSTQLILRSDSGPRVISTRIVPTGGNAFSLRTGGENNLTLAGGAGSGTVGGAGLTFNVGSPELTINRPLYAYWGAPNNTVTKTGTGALVLNESSVAHIGGSGINVNAGALIVNGGTAEQSVLTGTTTAGSPVITGLSSTSGLRVGQAVGGTGNPGSYPVIVSIDSASQLTVAQAWNATGTPSLTFYAVGGIGYNSGNVNVADGATLGGNGTIVMGSGKAVTVNAGGTIAPGSITAGAQVGTLTFTNNAAFTFAENAIYAWQYENGVGARVQVYGTLTLPSVATVNVSQVSGEMPATPTLFTATTLAGAADLSDWVIHGLQNYTVEIVGGTDVILKAPPQGTLIMLK